jgi:hypothetical protein
MSPAAKSVCYFGFYLYLVGLMLIFLPNLFLKTFQLPATNEVWIRVVGVLAFIIGYYYHRSGVNNDQSFFKLTILARILVLVAFTAFVLLGYVSPILIGFGVIDVLGAAWTWSALRKESVSLV